MAASSSKVTAEELAKAMADIHDLYARIPDDCKIYCTATEEYIKNEKEREEKEKHKKKKLYVMPPHQVQKILNYKCRPLYEHKSLDLLEKEDKEKYKDLRTSFTASETLIRYHRDCMRSYQEKIRHEYETKGYVTYEATDNEEEEEEEEATDEEEEEEEEEEVVVHVHQRFRGGGSGRRRHRPGVTKSTGGVVKRLN